MNSTTTTTYIDESQLIKSYYGGLDFDSSVYYKQLEHWINQTKKQNKLLLLRSEDGEGKKTFLVNWLNSIAQQRKDIKVAIIHFGSFTKNFSEIIYRTLIKLREQLDIGQKVELVEQTLRKYFPYWLEVCSKTLEQNCISEGVDLNKKILLIFEGVDHLVDSKGDDVMPSFWLPSIFPKNLKIITTATTGSKAAKQLGKKADCIIDYKCPLEIKQELFLSLPTNIVSHIKALNPSLQYLNLLKHFLKNKKFLSHFESNLSSFNNLQIKPLLQCIIRFWTKELSPYPVKLFLSLISLSKKGLTRQQIYKSANVNQKIFNQIFEIFKGIVYNYKDLYVICDNSIKNKINILLKVDDHIKIQIHRILAQSISSSANCIRKLEEQIYHLEQSHNYLQLKQTVSQIQNFLFLFNRNTKYILSNCWHRLETKYMFDPTFQYNKSIENYQTHYYPSEKDIFRIILQLSRFFIEYAGFETFDTPIFRHPSIGGDSEQLKSTSMYQEFKTMLMLKKDVEKQKDSKDKQKNRDKDYQKDKEIETRMDRMMKSKIEKTEEDKQLEQKQSFKKTKRKDNEAENQNAKKMKLQLRKILDSRASLQKFDLIDMLKDLNIEIPSNKDNFRECYIRQLQRFFTQNRIEGIEQQDNRLSKDEDKNQEDLSVMNETQTRIKKQESLKLIKTLKEYEEENYEINRSQPKYYYYKQWIWVQFPWISLSLDYDYSETIRSCIKPPTHYMSVKDQNMRTNQALKIAIEAKRMKESVLDKNPKRNKIQIKIKKTETKSIVDSLPSQCISMIDVQSLVTKNEPQSKVFLTQSQSYNPTQNSTYLKNISHKQNSLVLPQIKDLSTMRKTMTSKISHNSSLIQLKKVLDERIYENKQLTKKLKQHQFRMQQQQSNFTEKQIKKVTLKISSNKQKLATVQAQYAKSLQLLEKISIIINICSINKVHNLQCITPLNTFIQKLKFMIFDQQKVVSKNKQQVYLFEKQQKQLIEKLAFQQADFNKALLKQQKLLTQQSDSHEKQKTNVDSTTKYQKKNTMSIRLDQNQRPYQYEEEVINKFTQLIGDVQDEQTTKKIQKFEYECRNKRVLNQRYCELEFQYEKLKRDLEQMKKRRNYVNEEKRHYLRPSFTIKSSVHSLEEEYNKILKRRVTFQQILQGNHK